MSKYIMRLDDACEKRNIKNWERIEELLDKYGVKPLVGVIPNCEDTMMNKYKKDIDFWKKVSIWQDKGWKIALHGYNHVYSTNYGGINPVNKRSEFAGEPLEVQCEKIRSGITIFKDHNISPLVFFAPSHTFDKNTINAIKMESDIRIISDTIASDSYCEDGITYVPQQSGSVRKLPFHTITFCYHPNTMNEDSFLKLENFLDRNYMNFISFPLCETKRKRNIYDNFLRRLYFFRR